jgi:hypothetical protein
MQDALGGEVGGGEPGRDRPHGQVDELAAPVGERPGDR